jgi:hypothetical protein
LVSKLLEERCEHRFVAAGARAVYLFSDAAERKQNRMMGNSLLFYAKKCFRKYTAFYG